MSFALITLNQTLYGKYQANVVAFDNIQEDSDWLQDFADAIRETANDNWDGSMVTNWFLDGITVSFIDGDHITYSVNVDFTAGNLQGNELGDGMPGGCPLLVSTSFIGAAPNRGRIYFSGISEARQADGLYDTATRVALKLLVEEWRDGITIDGITASLQIARRPSAVFPTYVFHSVNIVNTTEANRSQRRRNLGQ